MNGAGQRGNMVKPDYPRWDFERRRHRERFARFVESRRPRLVCQDCHGEGGETVPILDDGSGPFEECGWCEGTGYVTPWLRGQWLSDRAFYAREKKGTRNET